MAEVTLSSNEFKALSSDTRVQIIKMLNERNYTLTELAKKMNMASPSMKQHLDILLGSGMIEQIDDGRKWKYYSLTRKGKNILAGKEPETTVLIVLGISSIALICVIALFIGSIAGIQLAAPMARNEYSPPSFETGEEAGKAAEAITGIVPEEEETGATPAPTGATDAIGKGANWLAIYGLLALIIILAIIVGFFASRLWRRKSLRQ